MTIARRDLVDSETPGFYHCTNRCVRRTFLCGIDELTGVDYSHRKDWLEKRMLELCDIFSVDIYAYAVMDNHYHAVLYLDPLLPQSWSKEDIAERWIKAYPEVHNRQPINSHSLTYPSKILPQAFKVQPIVPIGYFKQNKNHSSSRKD